MSPSSERADGFGENAAGVPMAVCPRCLGTRSIPYDKPNIRNVTKQPCPDCKGGGVVWEAPSRRTGFEQPVASPEMFDWLTSDDDSEATHFGRQTDA